MEKHKASEKVSDQHLVKIATSSYCSKWRFLPPFLDLDSGVTDIIDRKQVDEVEKKLEFLREWQKRKGSGATYRALIDALGKIDCQADAEFIEDLVQPPARSSVSTQTNGSTEVPEVLPLSDCWVDPGHVENLGHPAAHSSVSTQTGTANNSTEVPEVLPPYDCQADGDSNSNLQGSETPPPVLKPPSEKVKKTLRRQLKRYRDDIGFQYAAYVTFICTSLQERGITTENLATFLLKLPALKVNTDNEDHKLFAGLRTELRNAKTINNIVDLLDEERTSFLDYGIFQAIVKYYEIENEHNKEKLRYPERLKSYVEKHKLSEFIGINPELSKLTAGSEELILKFDINLETYRLASLVELESIITDILGLETFTIRFLRIEEGCVVVTFLIPSSVAHYIFPDDKVLTVQQITKFCDLSALWLKCCGHFISFSQDERNLPSTMAGHTVSSLSKQSQKNCPAIIQKTIVKVDETEDLMVVKWIDHHSKNVIEYQIELDDALKDFMVSVPVAECRLSSSNNEFMMKIGPPKVQSGYVYSVRVRGINGDGPGEWSDAKILIFKTGPSNKPIALVQSRPSNFKTGSPSKPTASVQSRPSDLRIGSPNWPSNFGSPNWPFNLRIGSPNRSSLRIGSPNKPIASVQSNYTGVLAHMAHMGFSPPDLMDMAKIIGNRRHVFGVVVPAYLFVVVLVCFSSTFYTSKQTPHNLPFLSHFVGREDEIDHILKLLDYSSPKTRIVNIYGPPGFGKSTLAIQIGHHMWDSGIEVNYINLDECPQDGVQSFLTEKISKSFIQHEDIASFDELLPMARKSTSYYLLILDNCDLILHSQQDEFQSMVRKVIENTRNVKFLLTSRETTSYPDSFEEFEVTELSSEAACELLEYHLPNGTNITSLEKKELTRITGNVPLALKVVGSLFRLPQFVSSAAIIEELRTQSIAQLSPKQLPCNSQINASFSLSYKHLSMEERQISRFLSYFPGSFSVEASIAMLKNVSFLNGSSETSISFALKELVLRSLLQFDSTNGSRYNFHCLIKEYFIEIEKVSSFPLYNDFTTTFQTYYLNLLSNISTAFGSDSYAKSLAVFDKERHNFVWISDKFEENQDIKCDLMLAITTLANTLREKLLYSRFSDRQLLPLLQAGVAYFKSVTDETLIHNKTWREAYLHLVYHLLGLEERVNSPESAMKMFDTTTSGIEAFNVIVADKIYIRILVKVSGLCLKSSKQHRRSADSPCMQYFSKALEGCRSGNCPYREYGVQLKAAEQYQQAARFFEASLSEENHTTLTRLLTLFDLIELYQSFYRYHDARHVLTEIEQLLPKVAQLLHYEVYRNIEDLNLIIRQLRGVGKYEEADALEESAIDAILVGNEISLADSYHLVKRLYSKSNYSEAVKLGMHVLQSSKSAYKSDALFVRLLLLVSKAKIFYGNFSDGYADMETVFNATVQLELHREYWTCCFLLIPHIKYLHTCYTQHITKALYSVFQQIIQTAFTLPLPSDSPTLSHYHSIYLDVEERLLHGNYLEWLCGRLLLLPLSCSPARFVFNFTFVLARIDLALISIEVIFVFFFITLLHIFYNLETLKPRLLFWWLRLGFTKMYCSMLQSESMCHLVEDFWCLADIGQKIYKLGCWFIVSHFFIHYCIYQQLKEWYKVRWALLLFFYCVVLSDIAIFPLIIPFSFFLVMHIFLLDQ